MRRVLVFIGLLLVSAPAFGYEAPIIHSFTKPTANGKYLLVMLHQHDVVPPKGVKMRSLKDTYGKSGLYPVNDATKPVWTCDWTANRESYVFVSDDTQFAVRVSDRDPGGRTWALMSEKPIPAKKAGWDDEPALMIYKNGQPFKTIALKDAFDTSRFTDRDCFAGPIVAIESFDDAAGRVTISTETRGRKISSAVMFRTGEVERGVADVPAPDDGTASSDGGPAEGGSKFLRGLLIGVAVVVVASAAFAALAFVLIRRQGKGTSAKASAKRSPSTRG